MIALLEVPVHLREVILKAKPEALLALGGRSSVPQLIDENGDRYPESLDIIFWGLSQSNDESLSDSLWPSSVLLQNKMRSWIAYNDHFFKYWLDRYKYADRHLEHAEDYYRQRGEVFLSRLETRLARSSYLFGEQVTVADIAIFPFIRQFAGVNNKWFEMSKYHHLRVWLTRFTDSDLFSKTVMCKFPAWEESQENLLFPIS
jgi:glutathione S-transferase